MTLTEALQKSRSNAAQAVAGDGKIITCQGGVLLHRSTIHAWAAGADITGELGYGVMAQESEGARPFHSENVEELWEVEESLHVNFGIIGLDWTPHEIEEA